MPRTKPDPQVSIKKQDAISRIFCAVMNIIEQSDLPYTSLFPKNGFKSGWDNKGKNDMICVVILVWPPNGLVQFNIYNKSYTRIQKQGFAIKKIMHQAIYDNIVFEYEMVLFIDQIVRCSHDNTGIVRFDLVLN